MRRSFTLIELLIVLVIIGVLVTLVLAQYQNMVERAKWAGPVQMLGSIRKIAVEWYGPYGKWPGDYRNEGMTDTQIFEMYGITDPNPPLPPQPNQFRYTFWGGGHEAGSGLDLLCCAYKDLDGSGNIYNPTMPGGWDPHIWICGDGTLSCRNAPVFYPPRQDPPK